MCHKTTWDCVFFKTKLGTEYVEAPKKLNMWVKIISDLTFINENANLSLNGNITLKSKRHLSIYLVIYYEASEPTGQSQKHSWS